MGYQYHGMWFDREHTLGRITGWVWEQKIFKPRWMRPVARRLIDLLRGVIGSSYFKNFR
jgi:hypothetical protein